MLKQNMILEIAQQFLNKFNQELEVKNKEIAELKERVNVLEERMNDVYSAWARYNCCGRHD